MCSLLYSTSRSRTRTYNVLGDNIYIAFLEKKILFARVVGHSALLYLHKISPTSLAPTLELAMGDGTTAAHVRSAEHVVLPRTVHKHVHHPQCRAVLNDFVAVTDVIRFGDKLGVWEQLAGSDESERARVNASREGPSGCCIPLVGPDSVRERLREFPGICHLGTFMRQTTRGIRE